MRELREHNECLLLNILPAHVAQHFLQRDRNDEVAASRRCRCAPSECVQVLTVCVYLQELYAQSYDRVGVLFASLPGFSSFYEQKEIVHQHVECLRLLNHIITDFDEVTRLQTLTYTVLLPKRSTIILTCVCVLVQLLDECYFQDVEKIKTIGSSYMAASGLSPDREVSPGDVISTLSLLLFTALLPSLFSSSFLLCVFLFTPFSFS